ncbi:MAG: DUF1688 family protein [Burkholderiales bacterium]|nr:DUF1688 family protein [Burkholderiales bacterium]
MPPREPARDSLALLRHPGTIRARCAAVLAAVRDERSAWFRVDRRRLADVAARVAALTQRRFPDLRVPPHSRWRHFEAGGVDRRGELEARLAGHGSADAARARIDLTVVSVLLDAGAGPAWRYTDSDGRRYTRSEGLGVASFRAFMNGRFSAIAGEPLRVDAGALARLDGAALSEIFQVSADNPMVGLEGRAALLARLGAVLASAPATSPWPQRPGQLYDRLRSLVSGGAGSDESAAEPMRVSAAELLQQVLALTDGVFTQGTPVMGRSVGDVWAHRFAGAAVAGGGLDAVSIGVVPFHKLSQWLSYSLLEPLAWAGMAVDMDGDDGLTGLPEYRNGGLLLDTGVIVSRDPRLAERRFKPGDEPVVEWRALTVALLDELAPMVRERLGRSAAELPLASILEGGTWAAGREIALEKREGGLPPLRIESDGTVF